MENPYSDDEASSSVVRMIKGLRIRDPDPNNDIPGVGEKLVRERGVGSGE